MAPTQTLFGLPVDAISLDQAVARCEASIASGSTLKVGVINAAKVVNVQKDGALRESLLACDMVLADGQAVVQAGSILGRPLPERVTGIDLFFTLMQRAQERGYSVYLLGAKPEVLEQMLANIRVRWPELRVAGSHHGYFSEDEADGIAEKIRLSDPDMLFLGMTTPKKERFVAKYGDSLGVGVVHGVGGSFDILAGLTKRAPRYMQQRGMEWLYRVAQEPRRLWRRYLTTNVAFARLVASEKWRVTLSNMSAKGGHGNR